MATIPPIQFDHRGNDIKTALDISPVPRIRVEVFPPPGSPVSIPFTFDGLLDSGASGLVLPEVVATTFNLYQYPVPPANQWLVNSANGPATMIRWPADVAIHGVRLPAGFEVFFNPVNTEVLVGREALFALLAVVGFEKGSWLIKFIQSPGSSAAATAGSQAGAASLPAAVDIDYEVGYLRIGTNRVPINND